jgi:DNA-binding GntR family transcriptional regulator
MPTFKFRIKSNSDSSITQQVADQIREAIETGRIKPGERLPSEMEIADQLGMSRGVGKKAYAKLKGQGLFFNSGLGRVVESPKGQKGATKGKSTVSGPQASKAKAQGAKATGAAKKGSDTAKRSARKRTSARQR